ncbi:rCG63518 [Rattus norvegicus]|uniref:RCG63518 n=1 Tax=Rattus norvegicus TaxID=10116 RepID=A6HHJ3_RAT|nr:rCG63518 [Rattus norvegicus]
MKYYTNLFFSFEAEPRLQSNLLFSCLSFFSAGITCLHPQAKRLILFKNFNRAEHDGAFFLSQHSGDKGRWIPVSSRPAWST